ncbi:hypothetical protein GALMADRAFT_221971 [Galerina marginata CBS 339.88]|uniref:Uncharacterized protein n=1 Tax=Galerina marginata (strain CBS 339.88) TaxID=685588 RepID=A0A067TFU9_GALM3|nr:hypothetical protein GALMADRAFT_221971 [Galerina marginata CBS 339.88]
MMFDSSLWSFFLLSVGVQAILPVPVTQYRAGINGANPSPAGQVIQGLTVLGVGPNGGTTYSEVMIASGVVTLSPPTGTPVLTTFTGIQTVTADNFVEHASWVYRSIADTSKKFNSFEQNCTFTDATKVKAECVEVFKAEVGGTKTQATTQTVTEPVKPWFTYVPPQTNSASIYVSQMWSSAFGFILAATCLW